MLVCHPAPSEQASTLLLIAQQVARESAAGLLDVRPCLVQCQRQSSQDGNQILGCGVLARLSLGKLLDVLIYRFRL